MKKVITAAILFSLCFISTTKAQAFTLDEAFAQIADLKAQVFDLQNQITAAVSLSSKTNINALEQVSTTLDSKTATFPTTVQKLTFSSTQNIVPNAKSDDVKVLQQALKDKGYYTAQVTGTFGAKTESAVKSFQKANNIPTTGVVGPMTKKALIGGGNSVSGGSQVTCNPVLSTYGPASATVLPGEQNVLFLNFKITSPANCSVALSGVTLGYQGTLTPSLVQNIKVFNTNSSFLNGTQVGNTITNGAFSNTVPLPPMIVAAGASKYFRVTANISLNAITGNTARFGVVSMNLNNLAATGNINLIGAPSWGNFMNIGIKITVIPPVDTSATFSTVGGPSSFSLIYNIRPNGQDIYLDKDVLINTGIVTGGQLVTFLEGTNATMTNLVPFNAQIIGTPTLTSLTPSIVLLPGGTYKIPNGQIGSFKINASLQAPSSATAPYLRYYKMMWQTFGFSFSDTNGTMTQNNLQSSNVPIGGLSLN